MACCKKISCRNLYYTVERQRRATSFPALFFGGQSILWLLFKLLCNGHFLLSLRWLSKTFITNCDVVITICDSLVYQLHRQCEARALRAREALTLLLRYTKTIMRKNCFASAYHKTQWKVARENPIILCWQLLKITTAFLRQSATLSLFQIATGTTKCDNCCKLRLQNTMV